MEKFFSATMLAHSSHEDSTYGRFGGPSSAFMSWPTVKPFYDASSYLTLKTPEFKVEKEEKMGKTYSFKEILDSGPPTTSVFMGLMQRRKRRENRTRRQRTTFTSEQTLKLELEYNRTEYISRPRRYEIAKLLNLSENQIKIWFQNRRAKEKRIEKAHIDQQIRHSSVTSATDTPTASHSGYPPCNPYVWLYPPATLTSLLPDTDNTT